MTPVSFGFLLVGGIRSRVIKSETDTPVAGADVSTCNLQLAQVEGVATCHTLRCNRGASGILYCSPVNTQASLAPPAYRLPRLPCNYSSRGVEPAIST